MSPRRRVDRIGPPASCMRKALSEPSMVSIPKAMNFPSNFSFFIDLACDHAFLAPDSGGWNSSGWKMILCATRDEFDSFGVDNTLRLRVPSRPPYDPANAFYAGRGEQHEGELWVRTAFPRFPS
nr:hypothetical protein CFP56_34685 [Quercus suber]